MRRHYLVQIVSCAEDGSGRHPYIFRTEAEDQDDAAAWALRRLPSLTEDHKAGRYSYRIEVGPLEDSRGAAAYCHVCGRFVARD